MSYVGDAIRGAASTANTTTTPLAGAATYTGIGDLSDQPDVMVSCFSDTAGTLYFDFSVDGTNWRTFPSSGFAVSASTHEFHTAVKGPRYFRVRFVNGTDAQSTFQLYTYFGVFRQPNSPLNQVLGLDADSSVVRTPFAWLDYSRNLWSGISVIEKFGFSDNIGTGFTPVCMAEVYQTPTSAVSLEFISSSANDALNSTGAHEISVQGLDDNFELQTVTTAAHATDGTTAVTISGTWRRVFRAWVSKSGAYATFAAGSHVGTITVRVASAGATYAEIPLINSFPLGQSFIGAYTIPSGYTGHVFIKDITVNSGKTADVIFVARESADDTSSSYNGTLRAKSITTGMTGGSPFSPNSGFVPLGPYTGPTDIGFLAAGASTPSVGVEFEIFLVAE